MPSEPSLKAISENLKTMVDMFARTPVGKLPLTPGSDTTLTDVLRFVVPQSEADVALEGLGGPIGKGVGLAAKGAKSLAELIAISPMGIIRKATDADVFPRARAAFFRSQKDPRLKTGTLEGDGIQNVRTALSEMVTEATAGNVILKRAPGERSFPMLGDRAEAFDPNFRTAEDIAPFSGERTMGGAIGPVDELIGALGSGNSVDEINRMTRLTDTLDPGTVQPGRSSTLDAVLDLPQADLEELAQAGSDLRRSGEFGFAATVISPETGEQVFLDPEQLRALIEVIKSGSFESSF